MARRVSALLQSNRDKRNACCDVNSASYPARQAGPPRYFLFLFHLSILYYSYTHARECGVDKRPVSSPAERTNGQRRTRNNGKPTEDPPPATRRRRAFSGFARGSRDKSVRFSLPRPASVCRLPRFYPPSSPPPPPAPRPIPPLATAPSCEQYHSNVIPSTRNELREKNGRSREN